MMHQVIDRHRAEIAVLCGRYGVTRLELFGSAARAADFDPDSSDADFLVEFDRNSGLPSLDRYFGLAEALQQVLGRPVDLVEPSAIKNPFLRAAIERSKELIYAA
jgi:predicted nucleotidyltransferase